MNDTQPVTTYYEENREKILEKNKKWHDNNQEHILNYRKAYYAKNKEAICAKNRERAKLRDYESNEARKKYKQEYYQRNKEKLRAIGAKWKENNKERSTQLDRKSHLKCQYNMTLEDYNHMLVAQNNLCLLCGKPLDLTINNPVDHDHKCCNGEKSCGKCIRGVLHDTCNQYIARIERYPHLLNPALKYIKFELPSPGC